MRAHMNPIETAPDPADPRAFLRALYDAAVHRALPEHTLGPWLPAPPKGRTVVVGAGKAGGAMAAAVDALWPAGAPLSGLVITRYDHVPPAWRAAPGRPRDVRQRTCAGKRSARPDAARPNRSRSSCRATVSNSPSRRTAHCSTRSPKRGWRPYPTAGKASAGYAR